MISEPPSKSYVEKLFLIGRVFFAAVLVTGMLGGILFAAAGRMDWLEAWVFTGFYGLFLLGFMTWGTIHVPELMQERGRMAGNVKRWDRIINLIFVLMFVSLLVVAGLDARLGWSDVQVALKVAGGMGIVLAGIVILRTIVANAFLARWARIQNDRGHKVVSHGPYRFVRHPMYAAIILFVLCAPFELGSWWAMIPASLALIVYVLRTKKEDQMLHQELEGYREYASQVRYRLIPGIW